MSELLEDPAPRSPGRGAMVLEPVRTGRAVLVASTDIVFSNILCRMVREAGLRAELVAPGEPGWLALASVEPLAVLCDGATAGDCVAILIHGAIACDVPVLLFRPYALGGEYTRMEGVTSLSFPLSQVVLVSTLDGLLRPPVLRLLPVARPGAGDDAAPAAPVTVREPTLDPLPTPVRRLTTPRRTRWGSNARITPSDGWPR